jgi:hypothetical protein
MNDGRLTRDNARSRVAMDGPRCVLHGPLFSPRAPQEAATRWRTDMVRPPSKNVTRHACGAPTAAAAAAAFTVAFLSHAHGANPSTMPQARLTHAPPPPFPSKKKKKHRMGMMLRNHRAGPEERLQRPVVTLLHAVVAPPPLSCLGVMMCGDGVHGGGGRGWRRVCMHMPWAITHLYRFAHAGGAPHQRSKGTPPPLPIHPFRPRRDKRVVIS